MKSRRSFVKNTTLATMALLAARSVNALAGFNNINKGRFDVGQPIVFLHNAGINQPTDKVLYSYFSGIRAKTPNTLVVNAGNEMINDFNYDVQPCPENNSSKYQIVDKGGVRSGIITLFPGESNLVQTANNLANELRKERKCQLVVCVSHLGYKKEEGVDDLMLAGNSENIDIIFGGHPENYTKKTMVILNRKRKEVIVQSSINEKLPCGKLEILFDENGNKRFIHAGAKLYGESFA